MLRDDPRVVQTCVRFFFFFNYALAARLSASRRVPAQTVTGEASDSTLASLGLPVSLKNWIEVCVDGMQSLL